MGVKSMSLHALCNFNIKITRSWFQDNKNVSFIHFEKDTMPSDNRLKYSAMAYCLSERIGRPCRVCFQKSVLVCSARAQSGFLSICHRYCFSRHILLDLCHELGRFVRAWNMVHTSHPCANPTAYCLWILVICTFKRKKVVSSIIWSTMSRIRLAVVDAKI